MDELNMESEMDRIIRNGTNPPVCKVCINYVRCSMYCP